MQPLRRHYALSSIGTFHFEHARLFLFTFVSLFSFLLLYSFHSSITVIPNQISNTIANTFPNYSFGHGPHRVKIALRFAETPKTLEYFIVETAPLALVPHAVHQFLEQVYHECWDNTWFYLNGQHVLQAGPQAYENEEEDEAALHKFQDWGFEKLAFPEYSKEFPHMEWTLGFTGRPGGPDFYINKHDNSMTHGPGGQQQHALSEHADPCFAKVIDGFDVVKKMYNLKVYSDSSSYTDFFEEPVEIVWAKIESSMLSAEETALEHANQKISNNSNSGEGSSHKPGKPKINDRTDMHSEDYADLEDYYEEMH